MLICLPQPIELISYLSAKLNFVNLRKFSELALLHKVLKLLLGDYFPTTDTSQCFDCTSTEHKSTFYMLYHFGLFNIHTCVRCLFPLTLTAVLLLLAPPVVQYLHSLSLGKRLRLLVVLYKNSSLFSCLLFIFNPLRQHCFISLKTSQNCTTKFCYIGPNQVCTITLTWNSPWRGQFKWSWLILMTFKACEIRLKQEW